MNERTSGATRRAFIKGSATAIGLGALAASPLQRAFAAYPERNFKVVIPTNQGGGAERIARPFVDAWGKLLGGFNFEFEFYPGAAGQVGYEIYIGRKEQDGHNLLFGNMGPEMIMYALQKPKYKFPDDYFYFCRMDVDDSALFVRQQSPFRRIEDVVAEGKKRTVNVATSRLPHPASIGVLALGEGTGAKFNLVPYAGGNPTSVAVLNGEVDCGVLPVANPISLGDQVRVLTVFNRENKLAAKTKNAPPVNAVFGTKIPDLYSSRAWAIHASVAAKAPANFERLNSTAKRVFDDAGFRDAYIKTGAPFESIQYGDRAVCTEYSLAMVEFANRYQALLSAKT